MVIEILSNCISLGFYTDGDIFRFGFVIFFDTGILPHRQQGVNPYRAVFLTYEEQLEFSSLVITLQLPLNTPHQYVAACFD